MKRWRWVLLIFELFLFALILVLPQVDLPNFAFQRDSAPIVAKSKLSPVSVLANLTAPIQPLPRQDISEVPDPHLRPLVPPSMHSLLSLLCTLLC
jgi:hypothetical protein